METLSDFNTTHAEPIQLPPGFRFHPTDEELITHYLSHKSLDASFTTKVIGDVDFNKVEPWDLPWKAKMGEKEWYFFCLKDRKYPTGSRTNRATESGYWKATGKDKEIFREKALVGMKKTLVFYRGRAPKGVKTNWVMHEYRLEAKGKYSIRDRAKNNEWVICRVFKKSSGGKKVHISCLKPWGVSNLPPLVDVATNEWPRSSDHVTCFSNPTEERKVNEFRPCPRSSTLLPNLIPGTGIMQCHDLVDQSMLRMLVDNSNQGPRQNGDVSSSFAMGGLKLYEDQEYLGQVDWDCLWNY